MTWRRQSPGPLIGGPGRSALVAVALVTAALGCENGVRIQRGDGTDGTPLCSVGVSRLDFGTVTLDETETRSFALRNLGDGDLAMRVVLEDSTGTFALTRGGGTYLLGPGQLRRVELEFRPSDQTEYGATLDLGLSCDDVELVGVGDFAPACSVTPTTVALGTIPVGRVTELTVTLGSTGGGFVSGSVTESCDAVAVLSGGAYSVPSGETHEVRVGVGPSAAGVISCELDFAAGCATTTVTATAAAVAGCVVSDPIVEFDDVLAGSGAGDERTLTIENTGSTTFSGSISLDCVGGPFSLVAGAGAFTLGPTQSHPVTVRFAPTAADCGNQSCRILTGVVACPEIPMTGLGRVTFTEQITSIFADRGCFTCHGAGAPTRNWTDYDQVREKLNFANPPDSRMLLRAAEESHTGGRDECFAPGGDCQRTFVCWIQDDAPRN